MKDRTDGGIVPTGYALNDLCHGRLKGYQFMRHWMSITPFANKFARQYEKDMHEFANISNGRDMEGCR